MISKNKKAIRIETGDGLIVVDVQNDFLPGGALAVPEGEQVIPVLNRYIGTLTSKNLPVFATRDWHPEGHSSFKDQGGPWPPHCLAGTEGAAFPPGLRLPPDTDVISISKGTDILRDTYSGFEGTDLDEKLRAKGVDRLLIGGLATDYCVLNTVKDAIKLGYRVLLLEDAIKAVNVNPDDGKRAVEEMVGLGALPIQWEMIE